MNPLKKFMQQNLVEVSNAIRNRVLDLTIELEKRLPHTGTLEPSMFEAQPDVPAQVFQQTIFGRVTHIQNAGEHQSISIQIRNRNWDSLLEGLSGAGLSDHVR